MPEPADVMNRLYSFFPLNLPMSPSLCFAPVGDASLGMHARGLWGTYHPELVEGPLPSRSTLGSYGVLREAQRGATPPDNDRFGFRFQRDVSKEYLTILMGCT